ncbi:hypothetical protein LCGC14_1103550 [marine sediment metagenome]|uniref:Uncharacterized protein n=1 Tax=marine sediment metagenome TaxID=412755 RepID=A0A0F9QF15_9ZZZZ
MSQTPPFSDADYAKAMLLLERLAQEIQDIPIPQMLQRIDTAETLGPILDPALWIKASDQLDSFKHLAQAANTFRLAALRERSNTP